MRTNDINIKSYAHFLRYFVKQDICSTQICHSNSRFKAEHFKAIALKSFDSSFSAIPQLFIR